MWDAMNLGVPKLQPSQHKPLESRSYERLSEPWLYLSEPWLYDQYRQGLELYMRGNPEGDGQLYRQVWEAEHAPPAKSTIWKYYVAGAGALIIMIVCIVSILLGGP
jgi:hypothetical protein